MVPNPPDVIAAGAVVVRKGVAGWEVLLVHRPRYDDWSFPKGKLDPGEHELTAAVREVAEETGLHVRLGPPLPSQRYRMSGGDRHKQVHYWVARIVHHDDVSGYLPNAEIDQVSWVPWREAEQRLTYAYDRETLAQAWPLRRRTRTLVVLRHGQASPRKTWRGDDRLRPLAPAGEEEARRLVPVLAAYDVRRIASSSSLRCLQTVEPYAAATGGTVETHDGLSEEDATAESVVETMDLVLLGDEHAVVCGHRPVLPSMLEAVGVRPARLEPSGMLVVHHRAGKVVATEVHDTRR